MSEIKVIKTDKEILSEDEFIARINDIAKLINLPEYEIENFIELHKESLQSKSLNKTDVLSLLIRQISEYNTVIPIVLKPKIPYRDWKEMLEFYGVKREGFGPVKKVAYVGKDDEIEKTRDKPANKLKPIKPMKPKTNKKPKILQTELGKTEKLEKSDKKEKQEKQENTDKKSYFEVETYFDFPKEVIYINDIEKSTSSGKTKWNDNVLYGVYNESVSVVGFLIREDTELNKQFKDVFPWTSGTQNLFDMILSGSYSTKELDDKLFIPYESKRFELFHQNINKMDITETYCGNNYILFKSDAQVKQTGGFILKYLNFLNGLNRSTYIYTYLNVIRYYVDNPDKDVEDKDLKFGILFKSIKDHYLKYKESDIVTTSTLEKLKPEKELVDFSKDIEKLTNVTFSFIFESPVLLNLKYIKAYDIIKQIGIDKSPDDFIKELSKSQVNNQQNKEIQEQKFKVYYEEMKFRWVYIRKFGIIKFNELIKNIKGLSTIKNSISKKERDVIEIEVERLDKYTQSIRTNKCPHVLLERRMRNSISQEQKNKIYDELKMYIPSKEKDLRHYTEKKGIETSYIRCVNCKLELICPHIRDLYELYKKNKSDKEVNDFISIYAGDSQLSNAYYCQICGEKLMDTSDILTITDFLETGVKREYGDIDDELRDYVWSEVNMIVKSTIEFKTLQTKREINIFITSVSESILELIRSIDKKLAKDKSSTENVLNAKRKFLTSVYVYAVLMKIVNENHTKLHFSGKFVPKHASKTSDNIQTLFRTVLRIILESQNVNIKIIDGMTEEIVKASLLQAYKNISTLLGSTKIKTHEEDQTISLILDSALYNYIAKQKIVAAADSLSNIELDAFKKFISTNHKLVKVLDISENEIKKIDDPFSKVKMSKLVSSDEFLKLSDRKTIVKKTEMLLLYESYQTASYEQILEYINPKISQVNKEEILVSKDEYDANIFHKTIQQNKDYVSFIAKYEKYRKCEVILFNLMHYYNMMPYSRLPFIKSNKFKPMAKPFFLLARTYGFGFNNDILSKIPKELIPDNKKSKFHIHEWNIHIYEDSTNIKGKPVITKKLDMPYEERKNMIHIDKICGICLHKFSNIEDVIKDPLALMEEDRNMTNFYNYYYNRCPIPSNKQIQSGDELHTYSPGKDGCLNCEITKDIIENRDEAYYKKYVKLFNEEKLKNIQSKKSQISKVSKGYDLKLFSSTSLNITLSKYGIAMKEWKYNPNIILQFAEATIDYIKKELKLSKGEYYNILKNIGIFEGNVYEEIKSGKNDPSALLYDSNGKSKNIKKVDNKIALRQILNIQTHIQDLFIEYYSIKNHKNLSKIEPHQKELLTPQLIKISDSLPDINDNFKDKVKGIQELYNETGNYHKVAQFLMEYFLKKILDILKLNTELKGFISFFIQKTINHEKMLSNISDNKIAELNAMKIKSMFDDGSMVDSSADQTMDSLLTNDNKSKLNYSEIDYSGIND